MITQRSPKDIDKVIAEILLKIYFEFCYRQKNQSMWEAGWETIQKIKV